jgi:hypothetical protein
MILRVAIQFCRYVFRVEPPANLAGINSGFLSRRLQPGDVAVVELVVEAVVVRENKFWKLK